MSSGQAFGAAAQAGEQCCGVAGGDEAAEIRALDGDAADGAVEQDVDGAPAGGVLPHDVVEPGGFAGFGDDAGGDDLVGTGLAGLRGEFEGFASVYDNIDLGGDVVERGAFQQFEKTADGFIRVLYQHQQANRRKRNG